MVSLPTNDLDYRDLEDLAEGMEQGTQSGCAGIILAGL